MMPGPAMVMMMRSMYVITLSSTSRKMTPARLG
jgi:hypothetical protein